MNIKDLEIVYMKVRCPKCGRVWGVVINGKSLDTIPERYLVCDNCGRETMNLVEDKEINDEENTGVRYIS